MSCDSESASMINYMYSLDFSHDELATVSIVWEFSDVIVEVSDLPPHREIEFWIDLMKDARPIILPNRWIAPRERRGLEIQVVDLLRNGFICRCTSEWGAPIVSVVKANGSLRLCVDYKELNKLSRKNKYPLPRIDDLFDQLDDKKIFSQFDVAIGFHQLKVAFNSIQRITFRILDGSYERLVMPFGFTNATAYFVDLMSRVFRDQLNPFVVVFVDNILVYYRNEKLHGLLLRVVLEVLRQHIL